jgi:dihydrodipicolinate synthase/N-acetylneuraminate lyase
MARARWNGVFPAVTTQFNADESLNIPATQRLMDRLIQGGVHGFIELGTVSCWARWARTAPCGLRRSARC